MKRTTKYEEASKGNVMWICVSGSSASFIAEKNPKPLEFKRMAISFVPDTAKRAGGQELIIL